MTEQACCLCKGTDVDIKGVHMGRHFDIECRTCGTYTIDQGLAKSVSTDEEKHRLKLQGKVQQLNPPSPGKAVLIERRSAGITARLIDELKLEQIQ